MSGRRPWAALLAGLACSAAVLVAPSAGAAGGRLTCHSGTTVFHSGSTRLFWATRGRAGARHPVWYACGSALRTPHRFVGGSHASVDVVGHFRASGTRVGFVWEQLRTVRFGVEARMSIGWVDVTTGAERDALLGSPGGVGFGDVMSVAVGDDGAMASVVKAGGDSEVIGYAPNGPAGLAPPQPVATVPGGDVMPGSLTVSNGQVSWSTRSGAMGAVRVGG
jgi:hypothetical protein